MRTS
jgi:hypothetical protein